MRGVEKGHLLLAWFVGTKPTATRHWVAGAIDAVHAATMLVLAAADRRSRRAAIAYAALAVVFASADVRAGRMSRDLL